ncbi:MAG: peptidoglycan DD-metalloendopeptidase family protein [Steroidobacteraceae bacterium]|nr:peptidoglycan DD-metalloendopeptidase family protein [Steroidobacteraceae bacterium]
MQILATAVLALSWLGAERATVPIVGLMPTEATLVPAPAATLANIGRVLQPPAAPVEPLTTVEVIVKPRDTLEQIFRRVGLDRADLATLRSEPALRGALDRLHPGETLALRHRDGVLQELTRRLTAEQTLHVRREGAGFASAVAENPLEIVSRTVHAEIDSSLFQAAEAAGISDATALAIADIFASDIDFVLDVQPGDSFTVTYEQIWQDGAYLHDGPVLAARFVSGGRAYRAVRYVDPEGRATYYSPEGAAMRKAFIRAPVDFTRISSRFNSQRRHPVLARIRAHKGVDYAAPIGTPIRAAGAGVVRFVGVNGGYGKVVEISHPNRVTTVYAHMSRFAPGLRAGDRVKQGEIIGYVGMSGLATGPHLHYEYRVRGMHVDPMRVPLPRAEPIPDHLRADFLAKTAPLLATLDRLPPPARLAAR